MLPIFADFQRLFYTKYEDYKDLQEKEKSVFIRGVGSNLFFIDHRELED